MENIVEEVATTKLNLALKSFSISKHNVRIIIQTFHGNFIVLGARKNFGKYEIFSI